VGVFLLYNTVFISVVKRRMQIGILRGLGADQKTVIMLFMLQGIILGSIGSVFGILLGQIAAYFSVLAVTKTISSMYSAISVPGYFVSARDVLLALILGLAVSLLASAIPAFESSKIRPYESLREGSFESKYKKYRTLFFLFGLFLFVSGCIFSWIDYRHAAFDFPFLAYFGVLFIIVGFTFISPSYLSIILKVVKTTFERMFGAMGKIAIGDVVGSLYRFSVALMSIAISSALIIALFTLIYSFRNSLKEWIQKNISADVYIKPASCISNFCFYPLSDEVVKAVGNMPEVAGIGRFRALYLDFRGKKVIAGFGERQEKIPRTGHDEPMREDSEERDQIGISRYLGMKYGLKQGDSIEVHTPRGDAKFVIRDIFSSYSTTSGYIYFDRNLLKKYWGLDDVTEIGISVKAGVDINHFIRKLKKRLSTRYSLEIRNNEELREKVLAIFNKSFAITYAIELISIMVSLIGVVNILLALVLERKRELSIIRYLGGSWKQIQQLILLSAGIVGICGISFGSLMGFIMSVIFVTVINELSFGWEIHFEIPLLYLSLMAMVLFSTTLFACLIPSRVARKIDPKKFISFE
jgi:putative ABC transport system permease protein